MNPKHAPAMSTVPVTVVIPDNLSQKQREQLYGTPPPKK